MKHINLFSSVILVTVFLFVNTVVLYAENESSQYSADDVWEVEIVKKNTNEVVVNKVVAINSFPLEGLEENTEYFARVRTKNLVFSGWATSDIFIYNSTTGIQQNNFNEEFVVRSEKGRLIISSTISRQINLYNVNGCLIRSVSIVNGETVVDGLEKGVYLANNRKVIVE